VEVFQGSIVPVATVSCVYASPAQADVTPCVSHLAQHQQPCSHVLTSFGVVGGGSECRSRARPATFVMEKHRRGCGSIGIASHLVQCNQFHVSIERGVLHSHCHCCPTQLLE